jgi:hypothetical protein
MAAHHRLPMRLAVPGGLRGLRPDRARIKQHLRPHQRHGPGAFREPLVPADPHADPPHGRVPDPEPRIPRREVELLLIARILRDMRLAIDPQHPPIRVRHGNRVEMRLPRLLEERDREHHPQLARQRREARHEPVPLERLRQCQMACLLRDAGSTGSRTAPAAGSAARRSPRPPARWPRPGQVLGRTLRGRELRRSQDQLTHPRTLPAR